MTRRAGSFEDISARVSADTHAAFGGVMWEPKSPDIELRLEGDIQ
jgi:hypothetical protein